MTSVSPSLTFGICALFGVFGVSAGFAFAYTPKPPRHALNRLVCPEGLDDSDESDDGADGGLIHSPMNLRREAAEYLMDHDAPDSLLGRWVQSETSSPAHSFASRTHSSMAQSFASLAGAYGLQEEPVAVGC